MYASQLMVLLGSVLQAEALSTVNNQSHIKPSSYNGYDKKQRRNWKTCKVTDCAIGPCILMQPSHGKVYQGMDYLTSQGFSFKFLAYPWWDPWTFLPWHSRAACIFLVVLPWTKTLGTLLTS